MRGAITDGCPHRDQQVFGRTRLRFPFWIESGFAESDVKKTEGLARLANRGIDLVGKITEKLLADRIATFTHGVTSPRLKK